MIIEQILSSKDFNKEVSDFSSLTPYKAIIDPLYYETFMVLFRFDSDKSYGLFIWNNSAKHFIEEPGTLDDYGFRSIQDLYKKYPRFRFVNNLLPLTTS